MTLPRLSALNRHWEFSPPAHVSIAAYLGTGKERRPGSKEAEDAEFDSLMASLPGVERMVGPDGR